MFSFRPNINFSDMSKALPSCMLICSSNSHCTLFEEIAVIQVSPRIHSSRSESAMDEAIAPRVAFVYFIPVPFRGIWAHSNGGVAFSHFRLDQRS